MSTPLTTAASPISRTRIVILPSLVSMGKLIRWISGAARRVVEGRYRWGWEWRRVGSNRLRVTVWSIVEGRCILIITEMERLRVR